MTPEQFIAKWRPSTLTETSASQSHFNDLCDLLELPKPADADKHGRDYTFAKSVTKSDGRKGEADVWKRNCFAWEYKGKAKNLTKAYLQLKEYADALDNPPLLIVSDMKEVRIHTNFTNTIAEVIAIDIADLISVESRRQLALAFTDPERLRPTKTREAVTAEAAKVIGRLAAKLRAKKYDPRRVAHFLNKLVFSMFVEDIGLLPDRLFADVLEESVKESSAFVPLLTSLFGAMRQDNQRFGAVKIPWFNGGLFDDDDVLPLNALELADLAAAARLDWSAIEPSIYGTLFEKGLDPEKRKEMASLFDATVNGNSGKATTTRKTAADDRGVGIHYTDPATIMKLVEPVVLRPLRTEWNALKAEMAALAEKAARTKGESQRTKLIDQRRKLYWDFRQRLGQVRVLDPACGSGNFLYLSLLHLKDFEYAVVREAQELGGLPPDQQQRIGPEAVKGIEINPYAAELARVTIWIGEIQWQIRNGFNIKRRPILGSLDAIECRDALMNDDGSEAEWPAADCIVGNPPFLGGKRLISALGEDYVSSLFRTYDGRVPREADLVCYWFEKARAMVEVSGTKQVGLVATNSIRGGANRKVLQRILETQAIFDAWSDEPWVIEGAAVRVSLISFAPGTAIRSPARLDGRTVKIIHPDLTAASGDKSLDLTAAKQLPENAGVSFMGDTKGGPFDISSDLARKWLQAPLNPNGQSNIAVLHPWINGKDLTRRPSEKWIVDFGWTIGEAEASLFELPFQYVLRHVKPFRNQNRREAYKRYWWRHVEPRPSLRDAIKVLSRYIVTPRVAKHRLFVWMPVAVLADSATIVIARYDDSTFGVLHSRFHEIWSLRLGTSLEDRPRYTPSTTFETFPFPAGLTPNIPSKNYADDPRAKRIAEGARKLNELREAWLNPPDLVKREPEIVPGFPDRIVPRNDKAAAELKKRTLTNLYNQRPAWLDMAHKELDAAVAAAYGWPADLSDDDILACLLALNLERAASQSQAKTNPGGKKSKH